MDDFCFSKQSTMNNMCSIIANRTPHCCKKHNILNNKIEQGRIEGTVVIITSIKLNKSIDFSRGLCYDKFSRDD